MSTASIFSASRLQTFSGLSIVATNQDFSWLPRKLREELEILKVWKMLHGSHSQLHGGYEVVVEERGGREVIPSDARYFPARGAFQCFGFRHRVYRFLDTVTVTAGFNEDGEMGVKIFDFANNLLENFHLQDGEMMNRRLTFEVKEAKPRFKVTYGLDEAGRLEMVVTVELPAEEDLRKMTSGTGWVIPPGRRPEYLISEYLMVSCIKKFHRIK